MDAAQINQNQQVLMLGIQDEIFAVDACTVREILDPVPITSVPGARRFVRNLLNVRGKVIPLADLRLRFGMSPSPQTTDTRFIVLEIELEGEAVMVGIIADKVYEVTEISASSMRDTPSIGMNWPPEFIRFIGKWKEDFVIVPNMQRIFN